MDPAEPVNLVVAVIAAAIGGLLFVGVFGRFFLELRRKSKLRRTVPDLDVDEDIRAYVDRIFLLIEAWRERLPADILARVDELWAEVLAEIDMLQTARNNEDDASEHVARLIDLEAEIEAVIDEA